jgi:hypothetical protein
MGWTTYESGIYSRQGQEIFIFFIASKLALGPTQPPSGVLPPGVEWPEDEADHLPLSSAEVKNTWSCKSTALYVFIACCLIKHRDNFTFISNVL